MLHLLTRAMRRVRRRRALGVALLLTVLVLSIIGNGLTFYFFDGRLRPDIGLADSLWYSVVSITTIGYGDLSSESVGARIGTIVFIMIVGLITFTTAAGLLVDWILDFQFKERTGMANITAKGHLLIVNFPSESRVRQIVEEFTHDPQHRNSEIVIVSDQIETLPFTYPNTSFVRGSPLEEDTYHRANIVSAARAIVLSTGYGDPTSDSVVASVISLIEHLNPSVRAVAECLSPSHALLFGGARRVSLVYTLQIANNLLVQEAQDPGVHMLTQAIISNQFEGTLASTKVEDIGVGSLSYTHVANRLLEHEINLVGIIRDERVHVTFSNLLLARADSLVYISAARRTWQELQRLLE